MSDSAVPRVAVPGVAVPDRTEGRGDEAGDEAETIHVPRAIQSHGFLMGVDPHTSVIDVVSENLAAFLAVDPGDALGSKLSDVVGPAVADSLFPAGSAVPAATQPRTVRFPPLHTAAGSVESPRGEREPWDEYEVVAHLNGQLWVFEFEPVAANQVGLGSLYNSFRRTLDHLRTVDGITALCSAAAREVRALTGYDRVLVYRFDAEAQGQVVAEARRPDMDAFLGLSYPAREVPRYARALYLRNWLRMIADVEDSPVGLVGQPPAGEGLDLTMSVLHVASADDLQNLRNIGVAATMTVSLVVDGRLWGLIACQHRTPRRVSNHVRASCEMLGRVLSLQIRAAETRTDNQRTAHFESLVSETVTAMSLSTSLVDGAAEVPTSLLGMVGAEGVVLQAEGRRIVVGVTPPPGQIDALVARVAKLAGGEVPPWSTDALPRLIAAAGLPRIVGVGSATGALYLPFDGRGSGFALWLRGEDVRTVSWAGGLAERTGAGGAPTPAEPAGSRRSFAAWDELVQGTSRPWLHVERAAAESFASALPALLLHRAQRVLIEQELAAGADRLSAAADKQQLEHRLHQSQRLESLGQLAGGVAHDFNNLLAVILNYVEFIGDEVDTEIRTTGSTRWRDVREDVEQVKAATARAAGLTRRLLAFARREVVQPRALNLNHVIRGLEHLLRRTLGESVELVTDLAGPLRLVLADPGQVEQILVNLAVNARDAMPAGGTLTIRTDDVDDEVELEPEPRTSAADDGPDVPAAPATRRCVRLRVSDNGVGIPDDLVDRIFEPFFTTKAAGTGTGLGLATVHGIVQQIGGVIDIESAPGRGTTFTMVFPATDVLPVASEHPADGRPGGGGETVLVVEDGDDLREVVRRSLTRAGYDVLVATNGYEAIEAAKRRPGRIDLLLTDLVMPYMTGDEVAVRIRAMRPETRVLFMSGYAAPVLSAAGGVIPDYPMLDKPFTRSALLIKLVEVLDQPVLPLTLDLVD